MIYVAWISTLNRFMDEVKRYSSPKIQELLYAFFRDNVREYGISHTSTWMEVERLKGASKETKLDYKNHQTRGLLMKLAENIYETGAFTEETMLDEPTGNLIRTVRIVVFDVGYNK